MPMSSARLFYDISERARRIIESYFLLNSTLHFSYTHLVCRTAITGQAQTQTPFASHHVSTKTLVLDLQQLSAELTVFSANDAGTRCRGGLCCPSRLLQTCGVFTGQQDHRSDLSHPIHADNCLLDPEANECWKEPPAYTYRDYRCRSLSPV